MAGSDGDDSGACSFMCVLPTAQAASRADTRAPSSRPTSPATIRSSRDRPCRSLSAEQARQPASTKWVEVRPVASTDSAATCRFVREDLVARHGVPKVVVTDNGTAFTAELFAKMCDELGIRHVLVTPGYPQANGLVERLNKTLKAVLAAFVNVKQDDWDDHVSMAAFTINAARQESTRYTPFELLQGRVPTLPVENRFPHSVDHPEGPARRALRIQRWREEARQIVKGVQSKAKRRIDPKRRLPRPYLPGDLVLVARTLHKKGKTAKFLPKFIGPFQVVNRVFATTYLVESVAIDRRPRTWRRFRAHESQLRPFRVREERTMVPQASEIGSGEGSECTEEDDDDVSVEDCPALTTIINRGHLTGQVARGRAAGADLLNTGEQTGVGVAEADSYTGHCSPRQRHAGDPGLELGRVERGSVAEANPHEAGRQNGADSAVAGSRVVQCLPQDGPPDPPVQDDDDPRPRRSRRLPRYLQDFQLDP